MHKLKSFATAFTMTSVFVAVLWAQVGMMATDAAGATQRAATLASDASRTASNPYQHMALTYGPSFGEFAALAR